MARKLGQPAVTYGRLWETGRFDVYLLPYQRGQRIPDQEDRFRFTSFELRSADFDDGQMRPAVAARALFNGEWGELFVSHFHGAAREPRLEPDLSRPNAPPSALRPLYDTIDQTGLGGQAVVGGTLLKLEAFRRTGNGPAFVGLGVGAEHEIANFIGTQVSVSLAARWLNVDVGDIPWVARHRVSVCEDGGTEGLTAALETAATQLATNLPARGQP